MSNKKQKQSILGQRDTNTISMYLPPVGIRNNCSSGQWVLGEKDFIGNEENFAVIKVAPFYGSLGKTQNSNWLQLWIIGAPGSNLPKNVVCVTYIKTRSMAAFNNKLIQLQSTGDPGFGIFKAKFEKHSSEMGDYFSLDWEWRERKGEEEEAQLNKICEFLATEPTLLDTNLPDTMNEILVDEENGNQLVLPPETEEEKQLVKQVA